MTTIYLKWLRAFAMLMCIFVVQPLFGQTSSSSCNGDNLIFYNANTGAGVSGKISSSGFKIYATYQPGSFATGWDQVSHIDTLDRVLFENSSTGIAAEGTLNRGVFTTTRVLSGFSPGWTNILYAGLHDFVGALPLFYNSLTGSGAVGFSPTVKSYENGAFATGWTHIVWDGGNTLFYNKNTGAGAVVIGIASPTKPGNVNALQTTKIFAAGSFSTWTNITTLGGKIVFYNFATGAAAIGRLTPGVVDGANNFITDKVYPANYFAPRWTHVIGTGNNLALFYNSATGAAAVVRMFPPGRFSPFPFSAGTQFRTIAVLPRGQLSSGFTHIACSQDAPDVPIVR